MSSPHQFDFGFESRTTDWKNAKVVLLFVANGDETDFGSAKGPLAIADASRYAEYYEMEGDFSPFEIGVCSEIIKKDDVETRVIEAKKSGKFPILVTELSSPGHLSVNLDRLQRGVSWYEFIDALEMEFSRPGIASAQLIGAPNVEPRSPGALLHAQVLIKMVGFICKANS